jgi:hypothetical protein
VSRQGPIPCIPRLLKRNTYANRTDLTLGRVLPFLSQACTATGCSLCGTALFIAVVALLLLLLLCDCLDLWYTFGITKSVTPTSCTQLSVPSIVVLLFRCGAAYLVVPRFRRARVSRFRNESETETDDKLPRKVHKQFSRASRLKNIEHQIRKPIFGRNPQDTRSSGHLRRISEWRLRRVEKAHIYIRPRIGSCLRTQNRYTLISNSHTSYKYPSYNHCIV